MNYTNQFLIAMPSLGDANFSQSVTYVCAHSEDGAMGLVINKPLDLTLVDLFAHMEMPFDEQDAGTASIVLGGPVESNRGFVLHVPDAHKWDSVLEVDGGLAIATSKDILEAIAQGQGPDSALVALGYAGWGAGQLEHEVLENAWLSGPSSADIVFDTPFEDRWRQAAELMGVDLSRLSGVAGHA
jgi:putative transcriptional regulator